MSTQTWKAADHPRNTAGGLPGNKGAFVHKSQSADDSVTLGSDDISWAYHAEAVDNAAYNIGVHDGETYAYRKTSAFVGPRGHATAVLRLTDAEGEVVLSHDYNTGVTSLRRWGGDNNTDPAAVGAAVRDIYGPTKSSSDLFYSLREEALNSGGMHPSMHEALSRESATRPSQEAHSEAVANAAAEAGIQSGHAYELSSTAVMVNPKGEPEAFLNLDDGEPTQIRHNYVTGETTYTCKNRGIKGSTDADLIQVAVDDLSREHEGDTAGMFNSLREQALNQAALHPAVRAALAGNR